MKRFHDKKIKQIEALMRQSGIRPTAQRLAICRFVLCEADHPTADDVMAHMEKVFPIVSTATVYNTLKMMVAHGLIRAIKFPHSDAAIYDQNLHHHYHFLDEQTGRLYDVDPKQVQLEPSLENQFHITDVDILFRGRLQTPPN
ncbi:MAG: transcriptional repressor [Acidobacteria bacterium]|nr:transcriptional repressor [Acidobacteriota bacterium]